MPGGSREERERRGRGSAAADPDAPVDPLFESGGVVGHQFAAADIDAETEFVDREGGRYAEGDDAAAAPGPPAVVARAPAQIDDPVYTMRLLTPEVGSYTTDRLSEFIAFVECNLCGFTDIVRILAGMGLDHEQRTRVGAAMVEIWDTASTPPRIILDSYPVWGSNKLPPPRGHPPYKVKSFLTMNETFAFDLDELAADESRALAFRVHHIAIMLPFGGSISPEGAFVKDWDGNVVFVGEKYTPPAPPSYPVAVEEGRPPPSREPPPYPSPGRTPVPSHVLEAIRRRREAELLERPVPPLRFDGDTAEDAAAAATADYLERTTLV